MPTTKKTKTASKPKPKTTKAKKSASRTKAKAAPKKRSQEELDEALFDALGNLKKMQALLAEGANPNARDEEGNTALMAAIERDQKVAACCRVLLEAGADVHATYGRIGWTALHSATAGAEDLELVEVLLSAGARPNQKTTDYDQNTALTMALGPERDGPRARLTKLLLASGADPNLPRGDGWTPLMLICGQDDVETAKLLIEAGADPKATKGEGEDKTDAMGVAAYWNQKKMIALLQSYGAEDPFEACKQRVLAHWKTIEAWCQKNAPRCYESLKASTPATVKEIEQLEKTIGRPIPQDLAAQLLLHGGKTCGSFFFEYQGLSAEQIRRDWQMMERLRKQGKLSYEPRELHKDNVRIRREWWHPGWLPFAMDGGGNYICVDLDPPASYIGQVLKWEKHAGPVGPFADDFETYLEEYAKKLTSGRYRYDVRSGTFDEA